MKRLQKLLAALMATALGWGAAAYGQGYPAPEDPHRVHGAGTANTIPVWTNTFTIGNSIMTQSGGNINVSGGLVATTLSGNGSGLTGVSAATLGGLPASAFAQLAANNTFTGSSNTFTGTLTLGGAVNNALTLQGNVSGSFGILSANVIGGFGGNNSFPGNSVAGGVVGATIAGGGGYCCGASGSPNTVSGNWGTIGGGLGNTASGQLAATVGGGFGNTATNDLATVGGGNQNAASNNSATVSGGSLNTASGAGATVAGGEANTAAGNVSFAAGCGASANNQGSFVWSGVAVIPGNCLAVHVSDSAAGQFVALASGGVTFYTASDLSTGATLPSGAGSWSSLSDRNVKANLSAVDGQSLLARLAALPVLTWNYKAQPDSVRHMGPMAQDFRAAFGLGEDDKHISTVDAEGVAFAAIQALYQTVTELKRDLSDKDQQIADLQARLAHLEQRR